MFHGLSTLAMHVGWIVPGALAQPTGGYIYDRLIIEQLRKCGDRVDLGPSTAPDVIVGDALGVVELGGIFECVPPGTARVLLVHHLTSWEKELSQKDEIVAAEARTVAACDGLVATSHATAARLRVEHSTAPVCDVVTPGADRLPRLARAPRDTSGLALCLVGSLIPRKRVLLVLDAIEELTDVNVTLRIVGDQARDPEHAKLVCARIDASEVLRRRVTQLGVVDDDALANELARADALVLASSLEGYGMVLTEALHAGLPLIAARSALAAVDVDPAAVVRFEDAAALGRILSRLCREPEQLANMQRVAESSPSATRSWREAGEAFRSALSRVISRVAEEHANARVP